MIKLNHKLAAVIVKGNPKYINDPKIKPFADKFYNRIAKILIKQGYSVEFDDGLPNTHPNLNAQLWIGHSMGIDRLDRSEIIQKLRCKGKNQPKWCLRQIKFIRLETKDFNKIYKNYDEKSKHPDHYLLSRNDLVTLKSL